MDVRALVDDLMDRSRLGSVHGIRFVESAADCAGADVVAVDLARHATDVSEVRRVAPDAVIVAFGSHVDDESLRLARADGADTVMARSRFFRDPAAALRDSAT